MPNATFTCCTQEHPWKPEYGSSAFHGLTEHPQAVQFSFNAAYAQYRCPFCDLIFEVAFDQPEVSPLLIEGRSGLMDTWVLTLNPAVYPEEDVQNGPVLMLDTAQLRALRDALNEVLGEVPDDDG